MKETFVNTKLLLRVKPEQRISENRLICGSAGLLYESVSFLYFSFFGGAVGTPSNKLAKLEGAEEAGKGHSFIIQQGWLGSWKMIESKMRMFRSYW